MKQKVILSVLPFITIISIIIYLSVVDLCPGTGNYALGCTSVGWIYLFLLLSLLFSGLTLFFIWKAFTKRWFIYMVNVFIIVGGIFLLIGFTVDMINHYKYQRDEQIKQEILSSIDAVWADPMNRRLILQSIQKIQESKKEIYAYMRIEHAGLYLSLYLQDKKKENLEKSYQIFSNTCYMAKDVLEHYDSLDYREYQDLFLQIQNSNKESYEIDLLSCLPYEQREAVGIKKLLEDKEFELVKILLNGSKFRIKKSTEALKEIKKLEDENLKKELITLLVANYYYGSMYSSSQRAAELIRLYPLVYEIKDNQDEYIQLLISNKRYEVYDEYQKNTCEHHEDILKLKDKFLELKSILNANSPILEEIPLCAKEIFKQDVK